MKQKEINEQISFLSPCYSSLFLAIQISSRALLPSPLPPLPRNWLAWPYQAALTLFSLLSSCRSLSAFLSTYVSPVHNVAVSTSSSTFFRLSSACRYVSLLLRALSLSVFFVLSFLDAQASAQSRQESPLPIHAVHVSRVNGTCTSRYRETETRIFI